MRITLEPQGRTFDAAPDESILDAAFRARIALPHGCRGGSCGSCRARLVSGTVDYPRGTPLGLAATEAAAGVVLLCRAHARSDAIVEAHEIRRAADVEVKRLPCRVVSVEAASAGVRRLHLRLPAIETFEFRAGQYVDVLLPNGLRRSYSIASPPHAAALLELHVGAKPGGAFSTLVFDELRAGALLRIEGPHGAFAYEAVPGEFPLDTAPLVRSDEATRADAPPPLPPALFVAGGTGFAPLKSMLRHVLESGSRRPLHLYWGARAVEELYDDDWLQERVRYFPQLRYVPVSSGGKGDRAHRTGLVHEAVAQDVASGRLAEMDVYAAGPPAMLDALGAALARAGWPASRVRTDAFD